MYYDFPLKVLLLLDMVLESWWKCKVSINELLLDVALNSWQKSNVIKTLGVSFFFKGQDTQTSWGKDQTSGNTSLLNKVHIICTSLVFQIMNYKSQVAAAFYGQQ